MDSLRQKAFFIGDWKVSPAEGLLLRGDDVVHLEPKTMELLVYFAQRQGEVVTREEIELDVWCGALVSYDSITSTVIKLRKALQDNAKDPYYISTIPKRGYELIASVSEQEDPGTPEGAHSMRLQQTKKLAWYFLFAGILVVAAGITWFAMSTSIDPVVTDESSVALISKENIVHQPLEVPSIAVLPFENMSGDPEQEYFSDGISEDIITDLSRLNNLVVIARNSSFTYKGTTSKIEDIGNVLNVSHVLEGSVRRSGVRVRITAQLIDASNGEHIWAERYDRELNDVFAVQDEVTKKIVNALAVRLSAAEKEKLGHSSTNNIAAYDVFLRGQQYFAQRTKEGNELAREAYRQAIEHDPTYARAYGALAVVLTNDFRNDWTELSLEEARARALELAQKAVALDRSSPQAYWALGFVYLFSKQYDEAAEAAKQAVALAPNYADGYGLLAFINNFQGRAEDAIRYIRKAMALNPYYTYDYPWNLGRAYYTLSRYPEAVEALQDALERNESTLYPRLFLAASYVRLGKQDDAEWEIEQIEITNPGTTLTHLANTFPVKDEDQMNAFLEDLRKAGLPE